MNLVIKPRRSGKTTELIKRSAETGYYMVVRDRATASNISLQAAKMELGIIPFPLTYAEFVERHYYGKNIKGFIIDDADALLQFMTTVNIDTISING